MPAINFCLFSDTSILFGIRFNLVSLISQFSTMRPVLGFQNLMVPSQEPLANFNAIALQLYDQQMKGKLKQKHIEDFLQDIDDFKFGQKQKINLEQHMTPPDIAAKLLFHIYNNEPIEEYTVADIGIGTGMLMCGVIYLQASYVVGFELDQDYLRGAQGLLEEKVEGADYDLVLADIRQMRVRGWGDRKLVDMVVMNPPFGTKEAGIDMVFLQFAMKICQGNIYSMHKSSTRKFIGKFCEERGYTMDVLFQVKFPLKKRFKGYHKKQVAFTEVDILIIRPTKELIQQRKNKKQSSIKKEQELNEKTVNEQ